MIRINCPYCGPRDHTEFTYGGDATRNHPGLDSDAQGEWYDYVFLRDNPRGRHAEFWHHVQGCRRWLRVQRNTLTHEIFSVTDASEPMPEWPEEEIEPEEVIAPAEETGPEEAMEPEEETGSEEAAEELDETEPDETEDDQPEDDQAEDDETSEVEQADDEIEVAESEEPEEPKKNLKAGELEDE